MHVQLLQEDAGHHVPVQVHHACLQGPGEVDGGWGRGDKKAQEVHSPFPRHPRDLTSCRTQPRGRQRALDRVCTPLRFRFVELLFG